MNQFLEIKIKKSLLFCFVFGFFILAIGFGLGWMIKGKFDSENINSTQNVLPLRLGGYEYINPLLLCDTSTGKIPDHLSFLKEKIEEEIEKSQKNNDVSIASVYFRNLKNGSDFEINPDEKYHPASLGKIPVMIAYYKMAEKDPDLLSKKIKVELPENLNLKQEIRPREYAKDKDELETEDLIEKMIKFSDNNALMALGQNISDNVLKEVYQNLEVPFVGGQNGQDNIDYMTTQRFSFFFRVLYNATYLNKNFSEKALSILAHSDFDEGLVVGVPGETKIAHKFGLASLGPDGYIIANRELHDCGIVYYPENPYLICVMTKGESELDKMEKLIQDISRLTYQEIAENLR